MPIYAELIFLALIAYFTGIGIGWALWGRGPEPSTPEEKGNREL